MSLLRTLSDMGPIGKQAAALQNSPRPAVVDLSRPCKPNTATSCPSRCLRFCIGSKPSPASRSSSRRARGRLPLATPTRAPAIQLNAHHATIFIRDGHFVAQDIVHELLHAHRFWIEGVPQLVAAGGDNNQWDITSEVENALEHVVIVPREARYFPDTYAYWNATAAVNWAVFPRRYADVWARRKAAFILYLTTFKLVTSAEVQDAARAALRSIRPSCGC